MNASVDQEASKKTVRKSASGRFGVMFLSLAFLILAGGFSWGFYYVVNAQERLSQQLSHVDSGLTEAKADNQQLHDLVTNQQATLNTLSNPQQGNKSIWKLAEAQYLVRLANDTLRVGDNLALVVTLLQSANQSLNDVSEANIDLVRQALANDIAALQQVKSVDRNNLYLSLSNLNKQVDQLPVQNKQVEQAPAVEADADLPWWRKGLHQSLKTVKQLVVIRYNAEGVRPFISPEQIGFLYQNVHAMLEQAMTALVLRQADIYRDSLQQASAWIKQYFVSDSAAVIAALNQLETLQAAQIQPELPSLTVLQAFQTYMQTPVVNKDTPVKS